MAQRKITATPGLGNGMGRPRRQIDAAQVRRLRNAGRTLNEIAAALGCGRGTVARTLATMPSPPAAQSSPATGLRQTASELARSRGSLAPDIAERMRRRENARQLIYSRWGEGMKVEGNSFNPPGPNRDGASWAGIALMAGGLLLWAMGCPVPL